MTNLIVTAQDPVCTKQVVEYQEGIILNIIVQTLSNPTDQGLILEILQALYQLLALDAQYQIQQSNPNSIAYRFEEAKGLDQLEEL